jgi:polyphenol oxidase
MSSQIKSITPFWDDFTHIVAGFSTAELVNMTEGVDHMQAETDVGINTLTPLETTFLNRDGWLKEFGLKHDELAFLKQVHGNDILFVDRPGLYDGADGLITNVPDLTLGILVADCAAVLAVDPENAIIGAFHAGWRGAVNGIVEHGITKMRLLGAQNIHLWMSPCISTSSFEVGEEVAEQFPSEFVVRQGYDKPHVDLKGYIREQILKMKIPAHNIQTDHRCTVENKMFHSFRRDKNLSGRMMAFISIKY